jgi:16S rRNA (cytidine1402-2'-O)-methyltransferase
VAVSASGLPTDRFLFEGFLPAKAAARAARLGVLRTLGVTIVLYESPHRLVRALEDVRDVYGAEHPVCVARELTKVHEEYVRGPAAGVAAEFAGRDKVRGEFVVIVAPVDLVESHMLDDAQLEAKALEMLGRGKRTREVRDALVASTQMTSSELYEFIESLKGK